MAIFNTRAIAILLKRRSYHSAQNPLLLCKHHSILDKSQSPTRSCSTDPLPSASVTHLPLLTSSYTTAIPGTWVSFLFFQGHQAHPHVKAFLLAVPSAYNMLPVYLHGSQHHLLQVFSVKPTVTTLFKNHILLFI